MNRRQFLRHSSAAAMMPLAARLPTIPTTAPFRLRIEPAHLEIAKGVWIKTTSYNGAVPGPVLRMREGQPTSIEVTNASSAPEIVHWHGLATDTLNDGAIEEGSPLIQPGKSLKYELTPRPAGTRWYHTHAMAMEDLTASTYSGQFGFLLVEPAAGDSGRYDREVLLAVHHWDLSFIPMVSTLRNHSHNMPQTTGSDVGYKYATFNAHTLGFGEPIRVKQGERVLFRLLNASATENTIVALPGHKFLILAMDGNAVPKPQLVETVALAVGERIDALVVMDNPGCWVLGSTLASERASGLGIVIEYANKTGEAIWHDAPAKPWDYTLFANTEAAPKPHETVDLTIRDAGALNGSKFDTWTMNGDAWPKIKPILVEHGKRYRLRFINASGDQHPMHLHRHTFEVTQINDRVMSGMRKDVVNLMPLDTVTVDFVADNPGDSLLHCHQQLHMDYGFMQMVRYKEPHAG